MERSSEQKVNEPSIQGFLIGAMLDAASTKKRLARGRAHARNHKKKNVREETSVVNPMGCRGENTL